MDVARLVERGDAEEGLGEEKGSGSNVDWRFGWGEEDGEEVAPCEGDKDQVREICCGGGDLEEVSLATGEAYLAERDDKITISMASQPALHLFIVLDFCFHNIGAPGIQA